MQILIYVGIFYLGMVIGYFAKAWAVYRSGHHGVIVITQEDNKMLYSIELADDPESLVFEREILLKVDVRE